MNFVKTNSNVQIVGADAASARGRTRMSVPTRISNFLCATGDSSALPQNDKILQAVGGRRPLRPAKHKNHRSSEPVCSAEFQQIFTGARCTPLRIAQISRAIRESPLHNLYIFLTLHAWNTHSRSNPADTNHRLSTVGLTLYTPLFS